MYSLSIKGYVGGEFRLVCQPVRNRTDSTVKRARALDAPGLIPARIQNPPSLVRSLDSERQHPAGVSGFGLLPRPTVFGLPARRAVSRLSRVMDEMAARPEDVIFFTGTLPGSTRASVLALSQWSGYVVHRLKSWVNSLDPQVHLVYCWEWQKRGALHLHVALWSECEEKRDAIYRGLRGEWIGLLFQVSDKSGIDVFARAGGRGTWRNNLDKVRARAEWVRKGVGAYLGKYMSKSIMAGAEKGKFFYPSRWWGSTRNLKDAEKRGRWGREYLYSCYGEALSATQDMEAMIALSAEWIATYPMKIVRGCVTVALGVRTEFVKTITVMLNPTKVTMQTKSLDELNTEFLMCMDAIATLKPKWFKGFMKTWEHVDKVYGRYKGTLSEPIDPERLLSMTYATASALSQSAKFDHVWNGEWLGEQLAMSAMRSANDLQKALIKSWDDRYFHINDTEEMVRKRNDFL